MDYLKVMVSIFGRMKVPSKVTSSRVFVTAMECGKRVAKV